MTLVYRPRRMQFGVFLAPFHRVGENPTLALNRDIELIELLDGLGFDEAWIGEHHSAGWELIADPGLIISAVAPRTKSIRLGTGVTSLPYHHPLIVADRAVQLDHMTRGRAMLGVGPGALSSDAYMMGINPADQRRRMDEALTAIKALFSQESPVSMETDWFTLKDARLMLSPYSNPHLEMAAAHIASPAGPMAAGKHQIGMISIGASAGGVSNPGGADSLAQAWLWSQEAADQAGVAPPSREKWRIVIPFHLSDSKNDALAQVREGSARYNRDYFQGTLGRTFSKEEEDISQIVDRGGAIVGTPDDAIRAIEELVESTGGFGGFMGLAHEWASSEHTKRSYELWARYVAPHFQGQLNSIGASRDWVANNLKAINQGPKGGVVAKAFEDAGKAIPDSIASRNTPGRA